MGDCELEEEREGRGGPACSSTVSPATHCIHLLLLPSWSIAATSVSLSHAAADAGAKVAQQSPFGAAWLIANSTVLAVVANVRSIESVLPSATSC